LPALFPQLTTPDNIQRFPDEEIDFGPSVWRFSIAKSNGHTPLGARLKAAGGLGMRQT
jgi:uncharacterized protein (DUF2249 family)